MTGTLHATSIFEHDRPCRPPTAPFTRVDLGLPALEALVADQDCIWLIRLQANVAPETMAELGAALRAHRCASGRPLQGLLVDVRCSPGLSVVRLSGFLDRLGALDVPVAVLFESELRYQLARVLYGTLANKRRVAYFTALRDAYRHLARDIPPC